MPNQQEITFPNKEVEQLWPKIYTDIQARIKRASSNDALIEKDVREILKKHLGIELIRTDAGYKKFFYDTIRFAVNIHTDKILNGIEYGRKLFGEAGSKGRISTEFNNFDDV